MENLWAPWRGEYINAEKSHTCILCSKPKDNDDTKNQILYRSKHSFAMMNLFPYSNGHLMISPFAHKKSIEDLEDEALLDLMKLCSTSLKMLRKRYDPQGFNMGLNLGNAAGAGIDEHLHIHIVPRWYGDTNFMTLFSEIRVIPEHLQQTYSELAKLFKQIK